VNRRGVNTDKVNVNPKHRSERSGVKRRGVHIDQDG